MGTAEGIILITYLAMLLFGFVMFVFWIIQVVDCLKGEFKGNNDKIIWLLVLLLLGPLGALIYHVIGKKQKILVQATPQTA